MKHDALYLWRLASLAERSDGEQLRGQRRTFDSAHYAAIARRPRLRGRFSK